MLTASPKSQEYKEAKKFLEEYEAKKKDVVEQPAHDETEEDSSDEDDGTDEDGDDGDGAGMTTTEEAQPSSSKRAKAAGEGDKEKVATKKKVETVFFCKNSNYAILPKKGTDGAAGYDLFSVNSCAIPPGEIGIVDTHIKVKLPDGTYGRVASRSSHAIHGVFVQGMKKYLFAS
ncbi:unnamed protein product [Orchesella dallaii]|uniref:Deoxyuridine 5'-triphosphate nucleotidohydrolase n=1 Tax=Orchesella dallaii TaxID=48710 RepID=A0ABP1RM12_9HEXA